MNSLLIDTVVGWSVGFQYADNKNSEETVKAGGSYIFASLYLSGQVASVANIIYKLATTALDQGHFQTNVQSFCNVIPIVALPFNLLSGIVVQGQYESFASSWNEIVSAKVSRPIAPYLSLPANISNKYTLRLLHFWSNHGGKVLAAAMVTSSLALIILGSPYYGTATLVAVSYQNLDKMGYVPFRVSLFMESYMPTLTWIGILIGGTPLSQVIAGLTLISYIPAIQQLHYAKIDLFVHKFFKRTGYTLQEMKEPIQQKKDLSYEEMQKILNLNQNQFEIAPAHCSKFAMDSFHFTTDKQFDKFMQLFEQVPWKDRYRQILPKLKDDENFIKFLREQKLKGHLDESQLASRKYQFMMETQTRLNNPFSNIDLEALYKTKELSYNCDIYIQQLADKAGISKEQYTAQWVQERMNLLIQGLLGKRPVSGPKQELMHAITSAAKLLAYLQTVDLKADRILFEDSLLKLAVEGGEYCSPQLKRAMFQLEKTIISLEYQKNKQQVASELQADPLKGYELQLRIALESARQRLIESLYQFLTESVALPQVVSSDLHGFDIYRLFLSYGFYPLTNNEENSLGILELISWELYHIIRMEMFKAYQSEIETTVQELGKVNFNEYLLKLISTHPKLSPTQKETLLEQWTECQSPGGKSWTVAETQQSFERLVLVMLGILRPIAKEV